jgi:hypothetical protein
MKHTSVAVLALNLIVSPPMTVQAPAQEATKPAEEPKPDRAESKPKPSPEPSLLRVQLVIARYQGEKKVGSVPYNFVVTTEPQHQKGAKLRMGVEVPVAVTSFTRTEGDKTNPATSFTYRNVGTNIDCTASERRNGVFALHLNVENSSVYSSSPGSSPISSAEVPVANDRPFFRTFNVSLNPLLRDGQNVQTVASTDPVSGEVVKIDVTLNVVK